jgi:hypothetical protein
MLMERNDMRCTGLRLTSSTSATPSPRRALEMMLVKRTNEPLHYA